MVHRPAKVVVVGAGPPRHTSQVTLHVRGATCALVARVLLALGPRRRPPVGSAGLGPFLTPTPTPRRPTHEDRKTLAPAANGHGVGVGGARGGGANAAHAYDEHVVAPAAATELHNASTAGRRP